MFIVFLPCLAGFTADLCEDLGMIRKVFVFALAALASAAEEAPSVKLWKPSGRKVHDPHKKFCGATWCYDVLEVSSDADESTIKKVRRRASSASGAFLFSALLAHVSLLVVFISVFVILLPGIFRSSILVFVQCPALIIILVLWVKISAWGIGFFKSYRKLAREW